MKLWTAPRTKGKWRRRSSLDELPRLDDLHAIRRQRGPRHGRAEIEARRVRAPDVFVASDSDGHRTRDEMVHEAAQVRRLRIQPHGEGAEEGFSLRRGPHGATDAAVPLPVLPESPAPPAPHSPPPPASLPPPPPRSHGPAFPAVGLNPKAS